MAKPNQMPPDLVEKVPLVPPSDRRPSENDDEDDTRPTINQPHPGVDDGFFPATNDNPGISHRSGPDGKSDNPEPGDGATKPLLPPIDIPPGIFPEPSNGTAKPPIDIPPGIFVYPHDVETGTHIPDVDSPILPDVNVYQHKKTLAQGMMDLALFSANANQLRYVLESSSRHPYFYPSVVLISFSLLMQVNYL